MYYYSYHIILESLVIFAIDLFFKCIFCIGGISLLTKTTLILTRNVDLLQEPLTDTLLGFLAI